MKKHFYSHLVDPEDIRNELKVLEISDDEAEDLHLVIESTIHHAVVDMIMKELPESHKHLFLAHIQDDNHDDVIALITEHISDHEKRIRDLVERLRGEYKSDIQELS